MLLVPSQGWMTVDSPSFSANEVSRALQGCRCPSLTGRADAASAQQLLHVRWGIECMPSIQLMKRQLP